MNTANGSLHQGIYDLVEVAHLIGVTPETIGNWTSATRKGEPPLVDPSLGWAFSFYDLVSLRVIKELRRDRKVKLSEIRAGIRYLARELNTDRPLAHKQFATVGSAWFANMADGVSSSPELTDAGKGGQEAFRLMVEPALQPLEYGPRSMAARWRPSTRVVLDPEVQAGAPCIEGTRIPTSAIAGLADGGEAVEDIAEDLELPVDDVEAALAFERHLAA